MGTSESTSEAPKKYMAPTSEGLLALLGRDEDVLRAVLCRAPFDDHAAHKSVCKRLLAVMTSRAFREERRASGCLEWTVLVMRTYADWWESAHTAWLLRGAHPRPGPSHRSLRDWRSVRDERSRLSQGIPSTTVEPQTVLFGDATLFIGGWVYKQEEMVEWDVGDGTPSADVYASDTATRGASPWRPHSRMRQARAGLPAVGVIGGRLYVAGGMVFHDDQEALLAAAGDPNDGEL